MQYLIFTRTSLVPNEKTKFLFEIRNVKYRDNIKFQDFIDGLVKRSKSLKLYINVYVIRKHWLQKIAWIKEGELYTL